MFLRLRSFSGLPIFPTIRSKRAREATPKVTVGEVQFFYGLAVN